MILSDFNSYNKLKIFTTLATLPLLHESTSESDLLPGSYTTINTCRAATDYYFWS